MLHVSIGKFVFQIDGVGGFIFKWGVGVTHRCGGIGFDGGEFRKNL